MSEAKAEMVIRPNRFGIGIDVGWRRTSPLGVSWEVWWGNTKDAGTLRSLIADAREKGHKFTLSDDVRRQVETGA